MSADESEEHIFSKMPQKLQEALGFSLGLGFSRKDFKYTEKKTLEFDPQRIKPGEAIVVKISKWDGLVNSFFAIMNVGGKRVIIKRLKI